MPELGFSSALYYQVSGDQATGRRAVEWGKSATDLRQLALVFDWCQDLMSPAERKQAAGRLSRTISESAPVKNVASVRSRLLAAMALNDEDSRLASRIANEAYSWWRQEIAPALRQGRAVIPRQASYELMELLHVLRDNTMAELRETAPKFFQLLPSIHLVSYYPATYPAPENDYRIPAQRGGGEPSLRRAALARASELAMVAYDTNAPEHQMLQGWLMHDNYMLRGTFGAPYEFLWANPYQPGLSYFHLPLVFHDDVFGQLFIRSSWEESAMWLGYFEGELQLFKDGKITVLNAALTQGPLSLEPAVVYFGGNARRFDALVGENEQVFVLGLAPRRRHDIEVDGHEIIERRTDPGGVLRVDVPPNVKAGVLIREAPGARP
jgi:hypothetical protein